MKNHVICGAALLGASLATGSAEAAYHSTGYQAANPAKSSFVVQLSGACKGKIELPVTAVLYSNSYYDDNTPGQVDKDRSYAYLDFKTNDSYINVSAYNYAESAGEKITESVKKGRLSIGFNVVGGGYWDIQAYFESLAGGAYDSKITCKDGGTLQQQIMPNWDPYYDARGNKVSGSLTHSNSTSDPSTGTYKAKFTSTGTMQVPSQCGLKGVLGSADYSLVCTPSKKITIKVTATAQGDSVPQI